jgi:hypothetical protein
MRSCLPLLVLAACTGTPRQAPKPPAAVEAAALDLTDPRVVVVPYDISASTVDGVSLAADYPLRIPAADDAATQKLAVLLPAYELVSVRTTPQRIDIMLRAKQRGVDMLAALEQVTPMIGPWCGSPARWGTAVPKRDLLQSTFDRSGATGATTGYAVAHLHAYEVKSGASDDTWSIECWVGTGERLQRAIASWPPDQLARALAHPALVVHETATTVEGTIDNSDGCARWREQGLTCDPIPRKDHFYPDSKPATTITRDRPITPAEVTSYRFSIQHAVQRTCDGRMRLTMRVGRSDAVYHTLENRGGNRAARTTHELTFPTVRLDVITGEQLSDEPTCDPVR